MLGKIASYYYLSHHTVADMGIAEVLQILVDVTEFVKLPVTHNEDIENTELAKSCPLKVNQHKIDSPHIKALLLMQCHFSRIPHLGTGGKPISNYLTDIKLVLDQALRVLQAMVDVVAESGWEQDSPLLTLLHLQALRL